MNIYQEEINKTKEIFNLDEILLFQTNHDLQIIRGEDFQYYCYIDKKVYAIEITPLYAMCIGVTKFKNKL